MGKKDPRVDAYIEKSAPFAKPILRHLRKVVHAACPEVEETLKWSAPHFDYQGVMCGMASFKEHCAFGFWKSSLLGKKNGMPAKGNEAMGQFGRITSLADLPAERTLIRLVKEAAALNEQGIKAPMRKNPPKPKTVSVPADVMAALRKSKKALATFEAFSPSHKREYVEWITEAKTDATRQKRLATMIEWLCEGKSRNWKYQKK